MNNILRWVLVPLLLSFFCSSTAFSHTKGENYIFLEIKEDHILGRFEFRYDDLKEKLGIDILTGEDPAGAVLQASTIQVQEYIRNNFSIGPTANQLYDLEFTTASLFEAEGGFAQYYFRIESATPPDFLHVLHNMFYEDDWIHRGVLVLEKGVWPADDYEMQIAMIFNSSNNEQVLDLNDVPELMTPIDMIWQGVLHIWAGLDHILFLFALILPIVLIKVGEQWVPVSDAKESLWGLLKIITAFTIAHSVTLLLAGLDILSIPSRLTESIIALSIILVALNNLSSKSHKVSLVMILILGLFHGLGFASVMGELPFWTEEVSVLILIVIGFNVGVELGQFAILLVTFPILFALRKTRFYQPIVLTGGSILLAVIAAYWFVQRAFDL